MSHLRASIAGYVSDAIQSPRERHLAHPHFIIRLPLSEAPFLKHNTRVYYKF
jgi:hypothetical protein